MQKRHKSPKKWSPLLRVCGILLAFSLSLPAASARSSSLPLTAAEKNALLEVCAEKSIDPSLALGLIYVESRFVSNVRSPSGCYGYCQLNPRYFPSGLSPSENIKAGIGYLGDLLERYDCLDAALTAYHDGHDSGRRTYANAVLEAAARFDHAL